MGTPSRVSVPKNRNRLNPACTAMLASRQCDTDRADCARNFASTDVYHCQWLALLNAPGFLSSTTCNAVSDLQHTPKQVTCAAEMDGSFRAGGTGTGAGASNGGVGSNSGNRAREALAATVAAASRVWRALPLAQRTRGPELWTEKLEIGSNLWQNAKREVVLNIEFMSNRTTRVCGW